jgi:hypothetical protein
LIKILAIFRRLGIDQNLGNIQEAWHSSKSWQYSGGLAFTKVLSIFRRLDIEQRQYLGGLALLSLGQVVSAEQADEVVQVVTHLLPVELLH